MFIKKYEIDISMEFRKAVKHFKLGIKYHYPICCILHFCIDSLMGKLPGKERRKILKRKDNSFYVPCVIHSLSDGCIVTMDKDLNLIDISDYI